MNDTLLFIFEPNTSFIAGQEETTDLTNVKIRIAETSVKVNDITLNNVSYPRRRVISPTEEEWEITTILKSPQYFQALPKKVLVKVRKKGADILYIKFNDQIFTSKAFYSMNALPVTSTDTSKYHLVLYGENLGRISRKYSKSIEDLQKINPGLNNKIQPGQKIRIN
jgi:LysM repeat protein